MTAPITDPHAAALAEVAEDADVHEVYRRTEGGTLEVRRLGLIRSVATVAVVVRDAR